MIAARPPGPAPRPLPRVVVAGPTSGVGKTTVAVGLCAALRRRGRRVQSFKAGPDYIDPGYLTASTGVPCRNLDAWILPAESVSELFVRAATAGDVAVVEGMMGLFDGRDDTEEGSTAGLAKLLRAPVVLVVDGGKTSRSAAAIVLGCKLLDPGLRVAGVILNHLAGDAHYRLCAGPIESLTGVRVFGYLPERPDLAVPERHLGLVPALEVGPDADFFDRLALQVEKTVDVTALMSAASEAEPVPVGPPSLFPPSAPSPSVRLGVATDAAFSFYYQDSLDLLAAAGADIVPFSPLSDETIPRVDGLYLGGGFPEVFAERLAANPSMLEALRRAAGAGLPIYAECGGLMYLSEGIVVRDGRRFPMVGLIPSWSAMESRLTIGYRVVTARCDGPILRRGETLRGHEFHHSRLTNPPAPACAAYRLDGDSSRFEGYLRGSVFASYVHLHLGARPGLAQRFVQTLRGGSGWPPAS